MSRIVFLSNAPWAASGYGEQTAMFVPRLQALGHEMAYAANYGLQAAMTEYDGLYVYPANEDWGNPTIGTYAKHHRADFVICLADAWVMRPDHWPDDLRMAIWAPLDHYPIPPAVLVVLQHEKVRPIAMSRFGEEWMRKFKLDPLYVPHGVDTTVFRPQPENRAAARAALSVPEDAFLVGMVAANKGNPSFPRKGFPQAFDAFARFARTRRDAYLYVHSQAEPRGGGIDLSVLARAVECPEDRVAFPPEHAWHLGVMDQKFVANLYAAFDVLLNPSMGEGFGIPILEAQACGVPVIASDHSAMTELTQAGWLVPGDRWWDALQQSFAITPSIGGIESALEAAYDSRGDLKLRAAACEFAQEYDADLVTTQYWQPTLEQLSKGREIGPIVTNRAQRRNGQRTKRMKAKSR